MVQKGSVNNMKVYELFKSCDKQKLYKTVRKARNLTKLSEAMFNAKFDALLSDYVPESKTQYYAVFTPYLSVGGSGMEHDLFLVSAADVSSHMERGCTPKQILLFTGRVACDAVSVEEVLGAEVCPLSQENFSKYDICAEIFLDIAMDVCEMQEYTIAQNVIFAYPYYASVANDAE